MLAIDMRLKGVADSVMMGRISSVERSSWKPKDAWDADCWTKKKRKAKEKALFQSMCVADFIRSWEMLIFAESEARNNPSRIFRTVLFSNINATLKLVSWMHYRGAFSDLRLGSKSTVRKQSVSVSIRAKPNWEDRDRIWGLRRKRREPTNMGLI